MRAGQALVPELLHFPFDGQALCHVPWGPPPAHTSGSPPVRALLTHPLQGLSMSLGL